MGIVNEYRQAVNEFRPSDNAEEKDWDQLIMLIKDMESAVELACEIIR